MVLGIAKTYTPSTGQIPSSSSYNTDIAALFNAFSGIEAGTSTLANLTITPSANSTTTLNVTNAAGTSIFTVDTTNSLIHTYNDKLWEVIYDNTLTGAATNVTISGLTGNTDTIYHIVYRIVSGSASATNYLFQLNADTTTSNYSTQTLAASSTTVAGARSTSYAGALCGTSLGAAQVVTGETIIFAKSGTKRGTLTNYIYFEGSDICVANAASNWTNTADEVTSIVLNSSVASGLAAGTRIQVFTRK